MEFGYHYLWLDSLCIIQDSFDDWRHESLRMGDIYANTVLNLPASSSSDSRGGLFRQAPENLTFLMVDVEETNLPQRLAISDINTFGLILEEPLNKRGWVMQERVLHRRCFISLSANSGGNVIQWLPRIFSLGPLLCRYWAIVMAGSRQRTGTGSLQATLTAISRIMTTNLQPLSVLPRLGLVPKVLTKRPTWRGYGRLIFLTVCFGTTEVETSTLAT